MSPIHRNRRQIRQEDSELHENGYGRETEHRKVFEFSIREPSLDLPLKLRPEGVDDDGVIVWIAVLLGDVAHLDIDRSPVRESEIRRHGLDAVPDRNRRLVFSDGRRDPKDMRRYSIGVRKEPLDAFLMSLFHLPQDVHGIASDLGRIVDLAVMGVAHQHQVFRIIRKLVRQDRITAHTPRIGSDDVRQVSVVLRQVSRHKITIEALSTPMILAATGGSPPDENSLLLSRTSSACHLRSPAAV